MRKLLTTLAAIALFIFPTIASAQLSTQSGGTGTTTPSGVLCGLGAGNLHLASCTIGSGLQYSGGTISAVGSPFPFAPQGSYNSTSTPIGFLQGLFSNGSTTVNGNFTVNGSATSSLNVNNNVASTTALGVSTLPLPGNLLVNPSFELGTTGWAAKGNATIGVARNPAFVDQQALVVDDTAGTPAYADGAKYNFNFQANQSYTLSFFARTDASSTPFVATTTTAYNSLVLVPAAYNTFAAGYFSTANATDTDCLLYPTQDNVPMNSQYWTRYSCTFTPGANNTYFYFRQLDTGRSPGSYFTGHKYYIDGVQLEAVASTSTPPSTYYTGTVSLGGSRLQVPLLNKCDVLETDASGNVNCGSDIANTITQIVGNGHSIMRESAQQLNGASNYINSFLPKLGTLLHATTINNAVGSAMAFFQNQSTGGFDNVLQLTIPPRNTYPNYGQTIPTAPYYGPNFLGVLMYGINDVIGLIPSTGTGSSTPGCTKYNSTTCNYIDYKEAMRTIIARDQASALFEDNLFNGGCASNATCVSYTNGTATWSASTSVAYNSGTTTEQLVFAGTTGTGSLFICVPNDLNTTGGYVDLGIIADATGNGAVHTIALDGTVVNVTDTRSMLSNQNSATQAVDGGGTGGLVKISIVRRIQVPMGNATSTSGCNAVTQHKITDTITNVTNYTQFDYYQIESTSPTPTLVLNTAKEPTYAFYPAVASIPAPTDQDVTNINGALKEITNEFPPSVMYVDEDTLLNKNPVNWSADDLHPNDQGHGLIALGLYTALENFPYTVLQMSGGTHPADIQDQIVPNTWEIVDTSAGINPTFKVTTAPVLPGGLSNLVSNNSFETDTSGWIINTGGDAISQVTTQAYEGQGSMKIVSSGGTAQSGTRYLYGFTNAVTYTASFYARLDAASAALTTLSAGYLNNTPAFVPCTLNSNTVTTTWARYSCTFTVANPQSLVGSGGLFIGDSSTGTAHTFYIDSVLLQQTANLYNYDSAGSIYLIGNIVNPVQFQNNANSSAAFQILNAGGANPVFTADTINNVINLGTTTRMAIGTTTTTGVLNLGNGSGVANGTTTIFMGKIQFDGYSAAGARICFYDGATGSFQAFSGACKP